MTKHTLTLARFSPKQLELFLVELANLQVDLDAIRRFRERFADFIPPQNIGWLHKLAAKKKGFAKRLSELPSDVSLEEIESSGWIVTLNRTLCNIWIEPDQRQKEWGLFAFRYALYKYEDETLTTDRLFGILLDPTKSFRIPPPTPFEQALSYLVKVGDKARYCANPECPAPYFFVQRKNQRYCSEICAAPAQRELKRQWWAEHGEEWRASRQGKKSSKKGSNKGKTGQKSKQTTKKRGK
jgi:hypothetical protein